MNEAVQNPFEIRLVEMYFGVPILEITAREPTVLTPEVHLQMARQLLELPYEHFALVIDFKNISHAADYGPEEEAQTFRSEPLAELARRAVAVVRFRATSITSLIQGMRVNMLIRHWMKSSFAPDFESAVRAARRAIDRMRVPTT